ncbi:uncharacterized protein LOC111918056 [Lactuca sativa]|uniref:uncharacterized protein LOC111918056 n=1 Tax=Lactuca sativa TaxID=4236 RepID=UPI000CD9F79F|nr:uncharacterized protein LOC111918056 [Lactuca sativa]
MNKIISHETVFNEQDNVMNENVSQEKVSNENVDFDDENINNEDVNVNNENVNISNENENENVMNDNNEQFIPPLDIYDPSNRDNLDNNLRDILIEKGPIRESNFVYPKDNLSRHFSYASYTRKLSHANDGFNDWKHLFDRLKEHENSSQHLFCMDSWDELIARFDKNKTIDKDLQNKVLTEKERWRILLTIPVTVASAERNFSKLKLLKNYLRSSMSQERLNGLAMLCIEKDLLDNIELDSIIDDFASKKARKCKFL